MKNILYTGPKVHEGMKYSRCAKISEIKNVDIGSWYYIIKLGCTFKLIVYCLDIMKYLSYTIDVVM